MVLGVEPTVLVVIAVGLVAGALVQGLVGLGLGLVAAPVTALVAPQLMPEMLLWLGTLMPMMTLAHERRGVDWRGIAWLLPGRLAGTVLGVLLVGWFSNDQLGVAVGVMVLASVLLTVRAFEVPVVPGTLTTAGFISGVTGTATSIGGPPVALLYQHREPMQIRSTLAVTFMVGAALSVAGLVIAGETDAETFVLAVALAPCLLLGFLLARLLHRVVPAQHVRPGVLVVCAASALVLLVRSLV